MLVTIFFRLCTFIGICKITEYQDIRPDEVHLNSFSSKTAYRNTRFLSDQKLEKDLAKCNLIQTNGIYRHGTRFPSAKDIEKMEQLHKKILTSHAKMVLPQSFIDWKPVFNKRKEKELASVGYEEMMLLGKRTSENMKYIMGKFDRLKHVKVFSSSTTRTKLSAASFYRSFLNDTKTMREITKHVVDNDKSLRFFDNCPYYTNNVINNKAFKMEFKRFMSGSEMKRIVRDIQQKWKLTDVPLSTDDVRVLYVMCGYEIATNLSSFMRPHDCPVSPAGDGLIVCPHNEKFVSLESSPLCSLFQRNHYEVVEYLYDLKHYWLKSYGAEVNWLQSCELMSPLMRELVQAARSHQAAEKAHIASGKKRSIEHFLENPGSDSKSSSTDGLANSGPYSRATFWFGHAETLLPLLSLLGLFNQSLPMTAATYQQHSQLLREHDQRFSAFRVSNMAPFAGNLQLDLLHCSELADENHNGYRVRLRVNERPVLWPLANYHSHISLTGFLRQLHLCLPDKYDHEAVCVQGLSANQLHEIRRRSDEL